jgi:2-succinyl-6-hydroxy-2,4-cyclohexadiene-1-carboxylate synthase
MSYVLLHGFTGDGDSWSEVLERLGRPSAFCPLLCGHGASGPPWAASFDEEADRLARLIGETRVEGAHLVGYSLGARAALALLVRHPRLFTRATLIGVNPGLGSDDERAARIRGDERWAGMIEQEGLAAFADAWQAQPLFATQQSLPAEVLAKQRACRLRHSAAGLATSLRVMGLGRMPDYWPALADIAVPLHFLAGGEDVKFRAIAERIAERIPCRVTVVPGAGHNLPLERPDAVAAALRDA